jgi:hypothetical protein
VHDPAITAQAGPLSGEVLPRDTAREQAMSDLRDAAARARAADELVRFILERTALRLRLQQQSWAQVGQVLGISRQAAHHRFRHLDVQLGAVELRIEGGKPYWYSHALRDAIFTEHDAILEAATARLQLLAGATA